VRPIDAEESSAEGPIWAHEPARFLEGSWDQGFTQNLGSAAARRKGSTPFPCTEEVSVSAGFSLRGAGRLQHLSKKNAVVEHAHRLDRTIQRRDHLAGVLRGPAKTVKRRAGSRCRHGRDLLRPRTRLSPRPSTRACWRAYRAGVCASEGRVPVARVRSVRHDDAG
jgi:hypothetical protein